MVVLLCRQLIIFLRKEWLDVTNNYTQSQRISGVLVGESLHGA